MPPVKIQTSPVKGPDPADVGPVEAAAIRASLHGPETAPHTEQLAQYPDWRKVNDQLGDPFSVEQIPISKLRLMRFDPTIGFGLSFIKTPHIRARWYIDAKDSKGPNAQIAAHLDHDLRRIMPSFVLQWCNCLDFGFQGMAKRFELATPAGTYVSQNPDGTMTEKPIWQEGNIEPVRWKPFRALPPETVEPNWTDWGEFDGINYDATQNPWRQSGQKENSKQPEKYIIDRYHSLWVTNERDRIFGSIFGYPRLGYAYRYWWSYWFRWAIADRAFEKKADPSIIIRHPEGKFRDPNTGEEISYADYALSIGYRMRSGGVLTIPSTPYEGTGGPTSYPEWSIDHTTGMTDFQPFDKSFDYLDIGKIRALWIPEQSLVEGKGGTSSRNVAAQLDSSFTESQAVLSIQIQETINRFIIPQWLAVNYPEFYHEGGGRARIIIQGFADEDVAFTQQVLQLIGQQVQGVNQILTMVDLKKILDDAGVPLLDVKEQQVKIAQTVAQEQQQSTPTPVTPQSGQNGTVGVQPNGAVPTANGSNADQQTQTGFTYIQPREVIYLTAKDIYDEPQRIKVRRVPDPEDGVIARFDPDENTVFLAESATPEDTQRYLAAIGTALSE